MFSNKAVMTKLKTLSGLFSGKLYVVGGAVRDFLLGYEPKDIDLAAEVLPDDVIKMLGGKGYNVKLNSPKLGTLSIKAGKDTFEYTCFRKDSYGSDGSHVPKDVTFVKNIEEDAFRRDFTVNALYYEISSEDILDYTGGVEDLRKKVIRSVRDPEIVINEDALRIMRMVRFAVSLGFEIEKSTFEVAQKNIDKLAKIKVERLREEFNQILLADTTYGIEGAHVKGVRMLTEMGAMKYLIPEIYDTVNLPQKKQWHKYDVFEHTLATLGAAVPQLSVRLAAVFHDIGKPIALREHGVMHGHDDYGEEVARRTMNYLKYPKETTSVVARLVKHHMFNLKEEAKEKTLRKFIVANVEILNELISLKQADYLGTGLQMGVCESADRLRILFEQMIKEGVPFSVKDLPVTGNDLIELNVPPHKRTEALSELLKTSAFLEECRTREGAMKFLRRFQEKE